jgi:peptidoglycan hydrolase-like protein with peptidoglycan-binding domain
VADGIYGRVSKGFVETFQRDHGLPVTGAVGVEDFEALGL